MTGCNPKSTTAAEPPKDSKAGGGLVNQTDPSGGGDAGGIAKTPGDPASGQPGQSTPTDSNPSPSATDPVSSTPDAKGPFTLRLALTKGEEMKFLSESEASQDMPNQGDAKMPKLSPMKSSSQTLVKVLDVNSGKSKVELTVSNLKLSGGMDNPEAKKMMEKAAKDSEGVKVSVSFDNLGQPSGMQYVKGTKAQAMSAGIDTDTGFFGITYPDKPVTLGDTWSHKFDFKSAAGPMGGMGSAKWKDSDITTIFTLKSVDTNAGIAIIGISAKGSPSMSMAAPMGNPKGDQGSKEPRTISLNFDVNGSGTATVDLKTGAPKSINYEMNVKFQSPMGNIGQKTRASLKRTN